jgi:glucosamine kinase
LGTGSCGFAVLEGRAHQVGGWGFPLSDEGSGAWLGAELLRRALRAADGRLARTGLLDDVLAAHGGAHGITGWMTGAGPRDYAALAPPVVEAAARGDPQAVSLVREAAGHVDAIARRLAGLGAERIALAGGLCPHLAPWLSDETRARLVPPVGDALDGALGLARAAGRGEGGEGFATDPLPGAFRPEPDTPGSSR